MTMHYLTRAGADGGGMKSEHGSMASMDPSDVNAFDGFGSFQGGSSRGAGGRRPPRANSLDQSAKSNASGGKHHHHGGGGRLGKANGAARQRPPLALESEDDARRATSASDSEDPGDCGPNVPGSIPGGVGGGLMSSHLARLTLAGFDPLTDVSQDSGDSQAGIGMRRGKQRGKGSKGTDPAPGRHDGEIPRNTPGSRATVSTPWSPRAANARHDVGHGGGGMIAGDQSEFTEYSEFENDGDYVVTEMRVVTTPGGGKGSGRRTGGEDWSGSEGESAGASGAEGAEGGGRQKSQLNELRRVVSRSRLSLPDLQINAQSVLRDVSPGQGANGAPEGEAAAAAGEVDARDASTTPAVRFPPRGSTPSWGLLPAADTSGGGDTRSAEREKHAPGTGASSDGREDVVSTGGQVHARSRLGASRNDKSVARALRDSFRVVAEGDVGKGGGNQGDQPPARGVSSNHRSPSKPTANQDAVGLEPSYGRVLDAEAELTSECEEVCLMIQHCTELRDKYLFVSEREKDPSCIPRSMQSPHYPTIAAQSSKPDDADQNAAAAQGRRLPRGSCVTTGKPNLVPEDQLPPASDHTFEMVAGVMHVYETKRHPKRLSAEMRRLGRLAKVSTGSDPGAWTTTAEADEEEIAPAEKAARDAERTLLYAPPATATQFFHDMHAVLRVHSNGPSKSFCHKRLLLTEQKFSLHVMLNADREFMQQKVAPHRDFYNVRKVDTHVHHSACMNQKHLLRFIKSKLRREPHELVIYRDGKFLNLREVFESINLSAYDLNVDTLDMHADKNTFHRFDRFNLKYNPCGQSRLREVFIKQDNLIRGRFLAEITKEVISDLEQNKYQMAEYRISIYGRRMAEWDTLAAWILNNRIFSTNVVWLIQLPRLYNIYRSQGTIANFQQMLDNIFQPLFEVTVDPGSHPELHHFLQLVVGFDMVDDESKPERRPSKHMRTPEEWDVDHNPAFSYYAYYIYANLYTLNKLRESKGLNTISFRPHAGEAGDIDHLAAAFLLTKNIAHGINLRKSPVLQYLFYLAQIGLNMSPLSNNSLFLDYHRNPFPVFFARGLPVALSTDDPLQIHMTKEPLVEEYSVAAQVWKMSACDLCEVARNSVLNSDFPHDDKQHWVSDTYWLEGTRGNDIQRTNVPNLRIQFRHDVLEAEKAIIARGVRQATKKGRELRVS